MRTVTSQEKFPKQSRARDHNMISCPELLLSEAITDITNILNSSHHYLMPLTTPVSYIPYYGRLSI